MTAESAIANETVILIARRNTASPQDAVGQIENDLIDAHLVETIDTGINFFL